MFLCPVLRRVSAHRRETNRRTTQMRISLIVTRTAALVTSVAVAQTAPTKIGDSAKGKVLTSDSGMPLYVFDRDADGKSACNGACTGLWPPSGGYSERDCDRRLHRSSGTRRWQQQWAYKKRPLYNWNNDQKPGDTLRRRRRRMAHRTAVCKDNLRSPESINRIKKIERLTLSGLFRTPRALAHRSPTGPRSRL